MTDNNQQYPSYQQPYTQPYPQPYPQPYLQSYPQLYPQPYSQYQPVQLNQPKQQKKSFIITGIFLIITSIILIIYGVKLISDNDKSNINNSKNYTNNNYDAQLNRFYTQGEIALMTPADAIVESDPEISIITINNRVVKTYISKVMYNVRLSMTNTIKQDIRSQITVNKPLEKGTTLTVYYQIGGRLTPPFLTSDYVNYPELNVYDDTNKKIINIGVNPIQKYENTNKYLNA
jgi:hypothetical protein